MCSILELILKQETNGIFLEYPEFQKIKWFVLFHIIILNKNKTRRKNLAMAWIDYKMAYDVVPQRWIIHCLKMYKISHEVINIIEEIMQTWGVELTAGGRSLVETKIQRGIFQGDALSPLLFIIAMMPLNHVLRKCIARTNFADRKRRSIT